MFNNVTLCVNNSKLRPSLLVDCDGKYESQYCLPSGGQEAIPENN